MSAFEGTTLEGFQETTCTCLFRVAHKANMFLIWGYNMVNVAESHGPVGFGKCDLAPTVCKRKGVVLCDPP